MKEKEMNQKPNQEINAIGAVYKALDGLDPQAQKRVLDYVAKMLGIVVEISANSQKENNDEIQETASTEKLSASSHDEETQGETGDGIEGISPVAQRWMRRNGLDANQLSSIFSLGVDEIDLVAKAVPEKSKRARMLNVFRLKGVAAYLSSGVARFTHEQAKETCVHYDAYDGPHFAAFIKEFAAEVSGSKESGYTLTARGLTNATELVKQMVDGKKAN